MVSVTRSVFGELPSGAGTVEKFRLQSDLLSVDILSWGCTISALEVKDRQGRASDVVLGFAELEGGLKLRPGRASGCCRSRDPAGKDPSLRLAGQECLDPLTPCVVSSERDKMSNSRTWPLAIRSGFASIDLKSQSRVR